MKKVGQSKALIAVLVIVLLGIAFLFFYLGSQNPGSSVTGAVTGIFKNCRDARVPYQETEYYTDYLKAQIVYENKDSGFDIDRGVYAIGTVDLKNIDNQAGWFTVTFDWKTLNRQSTERARHYVNPDQTVTFSSTYDNSLGEDVRFTYTYQSDPIQKSRIVTKYRTEKVCD